MSEWYEGLLNQERGLRESKEEKKMSKRWPPPKFPGPEVDSKYDLNAFLRWYAEHIEPLGPGVEVQGWIDDSHYGFGTHDNRVTPRKDTHRAILVGIQKIEPDSAQSLLKEVVKSSPSNLSSDLKTRIMEYFERTKE